MRQQVTAAQLRDIAESMGVADVVWVELSPRQDRAYNDFMGRRFMDQHVSVIPVSMPAPKGAK